MEGGGGVVGEKEKEREIMIAWKVFLRANDREDQMHLMLIYNPSQEKIGGDVLRSWASIPGPKSDFHKIFQVYKLVVLDLFT